MVDPPSINSSSISLFEGAGCRCRGNSALGTTRRCRTDDGVEDHRLNGFVGPVAIGGGIGNWE